MKILLTGGHPAPALAFIDYMRAHPPPVPVSFIFVGRQYNNNRERSESYEYREISDRDIPFRNLAAGRLTRVLSVKAFRDVLRIPAGFLAAGSIVDAEKPDRVLTFGGYLALPVAHAAYRRRIPVFLHEQTMAAGIAARIIGRFARRIFLSFPDTERTFDSAKSLLTGNLIRESVFTISPLPFTIPDGYPVLYVTGGSLGSHSLNTLVEANLEKLLEQFVVIHQIGNMREFCDFERLTCRHKTLPKALRSRYIPVEHITAQFIGAVYARASLVIGRAGANTVTELVALRMPSVLIPLPWAARDEQRIQARMLADAGVAWVFEQGGTAEAFYETILGVFANIPAMRQRFDSLSNLYNPHAARIVGDTVLEG